MLKLKKKINTIADLKLDIVIMGQPSFENFTYENLTNRITYSKDLYRSENRKVKNGKYTINIPIFDNRCENCQRIEKIYIEAENLKLNYFMYLIYLKISKKLDENADWHMFLEGFKKISEFEYEAILGS